MQVVNLKNLLQNRSIGKDKVLEFTKGAVVNLQLRTGEKIARHATPSDAIIHVVSGKARFGVGDETVELTPNELLHMDPKEEHELEALEDTSLLVIKVGSDTTCGLNVKKQG
jgi:quercetin dioxygenase-like cupin family protein